MPAVIGRKGIIRPIPVQLDETETKELQECAKNLRSIIEGAEMELKAELELEKAFAADTISA
jgi:L-lactate dehydrogenase